MLFIWKHLKSNVFFCSKWGLTLRFMNQWVHFKTTGHCDSKCMVTFKIWMAQTMLLLKIPRTGWHFEASHSPAAIFQPKFTLRVAQSLSSVSLSGKVQMEIPVLARMAPLFLSTPHCFLPAAWLGVLTFRFERLTLGYEYWPECGKGCWFLWNIHPSIQPNATFPLWTSSGSFLIFLSSTWGHVGYRDLVWPN